MKIKFSNEHQNYELDVAFVEIDTQKGRFLVWESQTLGIHEGNLKVKTLNGDYIQRILVHPISEESLEIICGACLEKNTC